MTANSSPTSYFIDSNIWLYALIQSQDQIKHQTANQLTRSENIFISTQVINEVCSNLLKKTSLNEQQLQELIIGFYQSHTVLEFNAAILLKAADLRSRYQVSFWDSLIIASALAAQTDVLLSEDMQHGLVIENSVEIVNPFR